MLPWAHLTNVKSQKDQVVSNQLNMSQNKAQEYLQNIYKNVKISSTQQIKIPNI